jgi:hypothetical protein
MHFARSTCLFSRAFGYDAQAEKFHYQSRQRNSM